MKGLYNGMRFGKVAHFDEVRIRNKFLWFPKTITSQTRWLEYAVWEEKFGFIFWRPTKENHERNHQYA